MVCNARNVGKLGQWVFCTVSKVGIQSNTQSRKGFPPVTRPSKGFLHSRKGLKVMSGLWIYPENAEELLANSELLCLYSFAIKVVVWG